MYVKHDGKRHRVHNAGMYDGKPGYWLVPPLSKQRIWAWESECQPWVAKPPVRKLKGGGYVLEFKGAEAVAIRRSRSSRRYALTLRDIHDYAERVASVGSRVPSALRSRRRRRS